MKILAIDPSGNFNEGKGCTGWALLDEACKIIACGQIRANNYGTAQIFWQSHVELIDYLKPDRLVVEDFMLYADKAKSQINSRFETSKLIGIIEMYCHTNQLPMHLQKAMEVKRRWRDNLLVYEGIIEQNNGRYFASGVQISEHIRDAIRHGVHYVMFKLPKEKVS